MPDSLRTRLPAVKRWALFYLYALAATAWNAGIGGAVATLGIAAGAALEPDEVVALDWAQMWSAFKYGAVINALFYLRSHPIPEKLPSDDRSPTPTP